MNPTPSQIGVSLALEAHRRGFVSDEALEALLRYYSAEGERPEPPELVLRRLGGLADAQVRAVLEAGRGLAGAAPSPVPSSTAPQAVGRSFGARLTLHERLGAGAMGTVFRAHDRVLQRDVAVKVLKLDDVDDPARRALRLRRFEREAKVMARVRHPGVVAVHDAGFGPDGEPYLVLELVQGQSLAGRLRDPKPVDPGQIARWGAELADALEACHVAGVVHRDVKPANVLIDAEGRARLTDFGVAHDDAARTRLTAEQGPIGTLAYMAPEQLSGREPDARTDVYALGATLHEALTGGSLFDAPHAALLLRKIVEAAPPPVRPKRPDCPKELEAVVLRCLAKDPAERYASAGQLARELERLLDGEPPRGGRGRRARRSRAARALRPLAWIAGATLVAGIATAVARRRGSETGDATPATVASGSDATMGPTASPPGSEAAPSPGAGRLVVRGSEVVNEKDGSVLVWVAPGSYVLGSDHGEENERPARRHELTRGFHIGKLEVTVGQYRRFCEESGRPAPPTDQSWGAVTRPITDDLPAFDVPWAEAAAYCAWAGLRLPTEAEWECAARGTDGRRYPWGNSTPTGDTPIANLLDSAFMRVADDQVRAACAVHVTKSYDDGAALCWPVGAVPANASPCGALDMTGNMYEWCADSIVQAGDVHRPIRGSAWDMTLWSGRCSARAWVRPARGFGFRVARDAD